MSMSPRKCGMTFLLDMSICERYLPCRLVLRVVCELFAKECWSVCNDRKPGALLVCNDRWLTNTAVCKPVPYCSQAATTTPSLNNLTKPTERISPTFLGDSAFILYPILYLNLYRVAGFFL